MPDRLSSLNRREFLKRAGMGAAGLALGASLARADAPAKRPNLIYILADQLRADALGYAGDRKARTPNLDRLARQSVNFSNAVSTMPVCAAHRASLLTGLYPSTTGMVVNELRVNPGHRALGHVLKDGGYETGYIGKWHLWGNEAGNHEEAARVPFLVRWPGRVPAGSVRDACLGTPDILPSVLGLMGLPIPAGVEGMDLSRLALGRGGPEPDAAFLQGLGHTYL